MTTRAAGPIPIRALAVLTAAVLAGHAVVVHNTALSLAATDPVGTRVFTTRILELKADAAPAPAPVPMPAAVRRPRAPPAAHPPAPAAVLPEAAVAQAGPLPEPAPVTDTATPPAAAPPQPAASAATAEPAPAPVPVPTPAPQASAPASAPSLPSGGARVARNYTLPGSVRLKFNANGMRGKLQYLATGELAWLHDGSTYEARLELGAFLVGSRVLRSTGRLTADGLVPGRFSDKFRSELAAHFDHTRGRVTFSANTPEAELLPGAQDQLSVFVQLAAMVAGEPARYPTGSSITLQTVGPRSAEPWVFAVEAPEKLSLPGGEQDTLKFTRLPRRDYDQKVEIWLAPALSYLPARIRITQTSGDFIDQQWRATTSP